MKFVCGGGGGFTVEGEALPYGIVSPLGKFCHGISSWEGLPHGIPSGGTFAISYNFRGWGLLGGEFPCDTGNVLHKAFIIYVFSPVRSMHVIVIVMSY